MPLPKEPEVRFQVCYKADPHYAGTFNAKLAPGVHGTFTTLAEAKEQAGVCRDWFSQEKRLVDKPGPDGVIVPEVVTTQHNNVIIWIDEYKDGVLVEPVVEKEAA